MMTTRLPCADRDSQDIYQAARSSCFESLHTNRFVEVLTLGIMGRTVKRAETESARTTLRCRNPDNCREQIAHK